jgi:hypothetical protein
MSMTSSPPLTSLSWIATRSSSELKESSALIVVSSSETVTSLSWIASWLLTLLSWVIVTSSSEIDWKNSVSRSSMVTKVSPRVTRLRSSCPPSSWTTRSSAT